MKWLCIKFSAILAAFCMLFLSGCELKDHPVKSAFFAMDTYMSIDISGQGCQMISNALQSNAEYYDPLLSVTNKESDIFRINHAHGEAITVDSSLPALIEKTKELCADLEGYLDVSLYPVTSAWGFTTGDYRVPPQDEIDGLLQKVDYRLIEVDAENNTVTVPDGMMLDFGAVAKGFLADEAIGILQNKSNISGIIDYGGTILPWGLKNNKELWTIGIQDPSDPSSYFGKLSLSEKVISTSGGYERYFIGEDGKRYIHIIDPKTGSPADNGTLSVTVICNSGIAADALSTALFVMGEEKAEEFHRADSKYGFEYILLKEDGELFVSEKIAESFTLSDGYDYSVSIISK